MEKKERSGSMWAVSGMMALLGGKKLASLGMFARGLAVLERGWREKHPTFQGGLSERWDAATDFYESTHLNPTNRWLHIVGIPLIVGGGVGLLAFKPFRPMWSASAGSFAVGWGLNLVGHAVFEKNAPAFQDDPLSFIAGPVWDIQQLMGLSRKKREKTEGPAKIADPGTNGVTSNGVASNGVATDGASTSS